MYPNAKGSETLAILATLDPINQAAGTVNTGWISQANFHALLAMIETGTLGAGATVNAKLQQALDNIGTGVIDIPGKAIVALTQVGCGSNKQVLVNLKPEEMDTINGFGFVRLSLTIAGAASQVAAQVLGLTPRFAPADAFDQAAVVQII